MIYSATDVSVYLCVFVFAVVTYVRTFILKFSQKKVKIKQAEEIHTLL